MKEMRSSAWLRSGSSLVWDTGLLGPLLASGKLIPLHTALSWIDRGLPADLPLINEKTLFIAGLQTALEVLDSDHTSNFLRNRVQRLVIKIQNEFGSGVGLIFGMNCHWGQWRVDANEHAFLRLRSGNEISVTYKLWNGVAREAGIIMAEQQSGRNDAVKEIGGGFYVRRFS